MYLHADYTYTIYIYIYYMYMHIYIYMYKHIYICIYTYAHLYLQLRRHSQLLRLPDPVEVVEDAEGALPTACFGPRPRKDTGHPTNQGNSRDLILFDGCSNLVFLADLYGMEVLKLTNLWTGTGHHGSERKCGFGEYGLQAHVSPVLGPAFTRGCSESSCSWIPSLFWSYRGGCPLLRESHGTENLQVPFHAL